MRISAELLSQVEQRTNPLQERELTLANLGIAAIENMGAARDDFDCYDLSNNRILVLENFPKLPRLSSILASSNRIESLDVRNLSKNLPNIRYLNLSHNNISSLVEIANIGKAFPKLEFLDLTDNPVTKRQYYRLYAIHHVSNLKVLDFARIKPQERETAERLANSAAGAALESDLKTFTPGESLDDGKSVNTFNNEEKEQIRQLLARAKSVQEIEEIENAVKRGVLPDKLQEPAAKRQKTVLFPL